MAEDKIGIITEELTSAVGSAMVEILGTGTFQSLIGDLLKDSIGDIPKDSMEDIKKQLTPTPEFSLEKARKRLQETCSFYAHMKLYGMESEEIHKKIASSLLKAEVVKSMEEAWEAIGLIGEKTETLSEKELKRAKNGADIIYYDVCSTILDLFYTS